MRFTLTAPAFAALVALVSANGNAFSSPLDDAVWAAGTSHRVSWANPEGDSITLDLMEGTKDNLDVAVSIGTTKNTGSITWQIPDSVKNGTYALRITTSDNSTDVNYSPWFVITNNNTAVVATTSAAATTNSSSNSTVIATSSGNVTTSLNSTASATGNSTGSTGSADSTATGTGSSSETESSGKSSSHVRTATATGGSSASASKGANTENAANIVGAGLAGIVGAAAMLL